LEEKASREMKIILNLIFALSIVLSFAGMAAEVDERLLPKDSPSKEYVCKILPGVPSGNIVELQEVRSGKTTKVYESERWVEVEWSPDSHWLVVTDHWDGHGANLQLYSVSAKPKEVEKWEVAKVYATPWPTRYNCRWKFVKWVLSKGFVVLHCDYESRSGKEKGIWISRDFSIPIDYP
jgi:hypothetical protein